MLRVVIPLVLVLLTAPAPELLYVQDGWVTGLRSGKLYEGTSPTRCSDGSIVYEREGDLWRDGERLFASPEIEANPSCVVDMLYESEGYVWRYSNRERLFEGTDPALSPDGRIAYVDRFQGIRGVYVRDGASVFMPYKTYSSGQPSWADGVLYIGAGGMVRYTGRTLLGVPLAGPQMGCTTCGLKSGRT